MHVCSLEQVCTGQSTVPTYIRVVLDVCGDYTIQVYTKLHERRACSHVCLTRLVSMHDSTLPRAGMLSWEDVVCVLYGFCRLHYAPLKRTLPL